ncbi:hypothetical protein X777_15945 [Ooceraea biroi]|uniref:Uncharacterized protein n=1 Tax=Ooceraea biroi TaxID=2015173 RepID=A0A026WUF5_OOCBI|nr:hypothetical protein X777_15945 [Ooceraea biroi]
MGRRRRRRRRRWRNGNMCRDRKRTTAVPTEEKERDGGGVEKAEEEMPLWKNITCWTAKERESGVGTMERERKVPREKVGENERTRCRGSEIEERARQPP